MTEMKPELSMYNKETVSDTGNERSMRCEVNEEMPGSTYTGLVRSLY